MSTATAEKSEFELVLRLKKNILFGIIIFLQI
jgi:hypothetical protein